MKKTQVIILAAGNGSRMKNVLPKVLIPVKGTPMVERVVRTCVKSGLTAKPVVVINKKSGSLVRKALGKKCTYAVQEAISGTGSAVLAAKKALQGKSEAVLVLYGDHPFVTSATLKNIAKTFQEQNADLLLTTVKTPHFKGWHKTFYDFGRIVRDKKGNIIKIVEKKDASKKELEIKEVNVAYYCFSADWLWKELPNVKNNNVQKEYYLTDMVKSAIQKGKKVTHYHIDPKEAVGVNDVEQLQLAKKIKI